MLVLCSAAAQLVWAAGEVGMPVAALHGNPATSMMAARHGNLPGFRGDALAPTLGAGMTNQVDVDEADKPSDTGQSWALLLAGGGALLLMAGRRRIHRR